MSAKALPAEATVGRAYCSVDTVTLHLEIIVVVNPANACIRMTKRPTLRFLRVCHYWKDQIGHIAEVAGQQYRTLDAVDSPRSPESIADGKQRLSERIS